METNAKTPHDSRSRSRGSSWAKFSAVCSLALGLTLYLTTGIAAAVDFGRVAGSVLDAQNNPLMGATVLITGPVLVGAKSIQPAVERILTDAHGKFAAEHLLPGWYSLKVTSPTRLPSLRNGIRVEAGQTAQAKFVLSDIFAPLRFQAPAGSLATWGDDWKWVLRTSATTRPILRFQPELPAKAQVAKAPLPASHRLIAMLPGSTRREALEGEEGLGSVLAYFRPLSADSDLLVAGAMNANGSQASSLATALRKHLHGDDSEELSLVMHQLSFNEGAPFLTGGSGVVLNQAHQAQGLAATYSHTRRLSDSVSVTAGMEIDLLNAATGALAAHPNVSLQYHPNSSNALTILTGTLSAEGSSTLLERVGELNAFPQVTLRNNRAQLEKMNHSEVNFSRKMDRASRAEIGVYRDAFENTAVWGIGDTKALTWLAGNVLPNPTANGVTVNAGKYSSSGIRAVYVRNVGNNVEAAVVYTSGNALTLKSLASDPNPLKGDLREILSSERSQSVAGKLSARIPSSKTQIITSYQWIERGRVTGLDPSGQASMQLTPFLGVQIRQPLPTVAFLPAHIEALADFRNLLAQGYVPISRTGNQLVLTPAYRSFRGGFSVEF